MEMWDHQQAQTLVSVTVKKNVIFGGIKTGIFETRRKRLLLQLPLEALAVQGKYCHQYLERIEKKDSLNDWKAHPPTGDWRRHFASSDRGGREF